MGATMISADRKQSREMARRQTLVLGRKQELNLQLNQLIDAVLLVFSLWCAHTLRAYLSQLGSIIEIEPFDAFLWLIALIMPLGPLLLDLNGFYNFPSQK